MSNWALIGQTGVCTTVRVGRNLLLIMLFSLLPVIVIAESKAAPIRIDEEATPVIVWNREITRLRGYFENLSPSQRATSIVDRILSIPSDQPSYEVEAKDAIVANYTGAWILVNKKIIFGLMREDANLAEGETFEAFKQKAVDNLKAWLAVRAEQQKWPLLLEG